MNIYIYKLTTESYKTYIGRRKCEKNKTPETDMYFGSSTYIRKHPEDKIIKKEILISGITDDFTGNLMETICIQDEKYINGENCVNYNLGAYYFNCKWRQEGEYYPTEKTKQKLSIAIKAKGSTITEEGRKRLSEKTKSWYKNATEEQLKNLSEAISKAKKGHKMSKETINKILNSEGYKNRNKYHNLGKKASEETRRRLSESHKGKQSHLGIPHSDETKAKLKIKNADRLKRCKNAYYEYKKSNSDMSWNDFQKFFKSGF